MDDGCIWCYTWLDVTHGEYVHGKHAQSFVERAFNKVYDYE